jgi:hypothetical protein
LSSVGKTFCLQSAKPFVFSQQIQAQTTHPCPFERKGNESFESVSKKWGKINIALHPLVRTGGDARYIIAILFVVWQNYSGFIFFWNVI